jgi:hypothetical protein
VYRASPRGGCTEKPARYATYIALARRRSAAGSGPYATRLLRSTTDTASAQDGPAAKEIRVRTGFRSHGAFLSSVVQFPFMP